MPKDPRKEISSELDQLKKHGIAVIMIPSEKNNRILYQIVKYKKNPKGPLDFDAVSSMSLTSVELRAYVKGFFEISASLKK